MNENSTFAARLAGFLLDDGETTQEQVRRDLEEAGVDVDHFIADINTTIRRVHQSQIRNRACTERNQSEEVAAAISQKILSFPIDRVRRIIEEAEKGKFGALGQDLAIACRNQQDQEATEDELRALAEDILQTTDTESEA